MIASGVVDEICAGEEAQKRAVLRKMKVERKEMEKKK